ncbi:MAG: alkaline phosphatase family protein [Deltaproteobacteria bacterium]|jgi:phospholipase C|nr:alkaline phosphatase family protein [Deltaproteobacteria bacterium]
MHTKVRGLVSRAVAAGMLFGLAMTQTAPAGAVGATATPIKHLVVIFGENRSFDNYFGTYPNAANLRGEPQFKAAPGTPNVNGLNGPLLTVNPNLLNAANGTGAANPFRLDRSQNLTADQDHDYTPEQQAFNSGLMDSFPEFTGTAGPPPGTPPSTVETTGLVMGYYDGNTVTALWNYAQKFALNDNDYGTTFGPSSPGALNLASGQTNGIIKTENGPSSDWIGDGSGGLTLISDADPILDVCSTPTGPKVQMGGPNIGNLLNGAGITWGWFEGGFNLSIVNRNGSTGCSRNTTSPITGVNKSDYIPHHQPFQYYLSTANPNHVRPSSVSSIGSTDAANHQYDIEDFFAALSAGNLPAVSFLKAIGSQDAHAGYSSPLDEQVFVVTVLNTLQQSDFWKSTAVVILYDDSDGWYDHQIGPIVNQSNTTADALTGSGACGDGSSALPGVNPGTLHAQGRCGYGPRMPLLVVSSWAKQNVVDHTLTDQSSVIRFVEDNWLGGQRLGAGSADVNAGTIQNMFNFSAPNNTKLILDPSSGQPI